MTDHLMFSPDQIRNDTAEFHKMRDNEAFAFGLEDDEWLTMEAAPALEDLEQKLRAKRSDSRYLQLAVKAKSDFNRVSRPEDTGAMKDLDFDHVERLRIFGPCNTLAFVWNNEIYFVKSFVSFDEAEIYAKFWRNSMCVQILIRIESPLNKRLGSAASLDGRQVWDLPPV